MKEPQAKEAQSGKSPFLPVILKVTLPNRCYSQAQEQRGARLSSDCLSLGQSVFTQAIRSIRSHKAWRLTQALWVLPSMLCGQPPSLFLKETRHPWETASKPQHLQPVSSLVTPELQEPDSDPDSDSAMSWPCKLWVVVSLLWVISIPVSKWQMPTVPTS